MKKYELVETFSGRKRVKALIDFADVKAGDLGGWIEGEHNLSHSGNCWVYADASVEAAAQVGENAQIKGTAQVYGKAAIYGAAIISGKAQVSGNARVEDNAQVSDNCADNCAVYGDAAIRDDAQIMGISCVHGNAVIFGNAIVKGGPGNSSIFIRDWAAIGDGAVITCRDDFIVFSNVGSERGRLTAYRTNAGASVNRGCFTGTLAQFRSAVTKKHSDTKWAKEYEAMCKVAEIRFNLPGA